MKDTYYFSHDANARNDPKILMMRSIYSYEGYGWYWAIIEIMREQKDYKLKIAYNAIYKGLAVQLQTTPEKMEEFIKDCTHFELFNTDNEYIWSDSLNKRMAIKDKKSEKARESAKARWGKNNMVKESKKSTEKSNKPKKVNEVKEVKEVKEVNEVKEVKKEGIENVSEINKFYEENGFGIMGSSIAQEIISYLDDGMNEEIIIEALKIALNNNKISWSYSKACLNDWFNKKIKNKKDLDVYLKSRELKKEQNKNNTKTNKQKNNYSYIPQHNNFQQRKYDPEYLRSLYEEV